MSNKHLVGDPKYYDEIGKLQFDFMVSQGLKPHHKLLDIGCGCLRGGKHFIEYLDKRNYTGIDKSKELIETGAKEYQDLFFNKVPTLKWIKDLNFDIITQEFDYILAFSLFTHLNLNEILKVLYQIEHLLKSDGKFFFSYFTGKYNELNEQVPGLTTSFLSNPYHYQYTLFRFLISDSNLKLDFIPNFSSPSNQRMGVIFK